MSIQVVPIRRTPKKIELLDYKQPKNKQIQPGQLVKIPFRSSEIFGIVYKTNNKSKAETKLKEIKKVIHDTPLISEKKLNWYQKISDVYNLALSTQLKLALLPLQPRKLKKVNLAELPQTTNDSKTVNLNYKFFTDQDEHKKIIEGLTTPALVVVPELKYIEQIKNFSSLPEKKIITWHSELSQKERFSRWMKIRNQEFKLVIGSRSSVFLPFGNLGEILIDFEHDQNHKHWDQTPRYHTHDIAQDIAKFYQADLTFSSFSTSCSSYFHIYKNNYNYKNKTKDKITNSEASKKIEIINLKQEQKRDKFEIFSYKLEDLITDESSTNFIYLNRKGYASSVGCYECGYLAECKQCGLSLIFKKSSQSLYCSHCRTNKKFSPNCPECSEPIVNFQGLGTEKVEEKITKLNPNVSGQELLRIEKGNEISSNKIDYTCNPNIIGTDRAFQQLNWNKVDNIIFANIDRQLRLPEFKASEQVWHRIQQVEYNRTEDSNFYIQTFNPNQLVLKSLNEPDRFYRMDLNSRKNLNYPPYCFLIRFFYGNKSQQKTKREAQEVYSKLRKKLTKINQDNIIINEPIEMQPKFYRNQYWQAIIAKLPKSNWREILIKINETLSDQWKIDPNPISVLSH
jgi:primosomal protein N' (replication factor Y)